MRVLAGIGGVALIVLLLSEFFIAFMLPRRVRRDPRIARRVNRFLWRPWRALSRRFAPATADTMLGLFGPLALLIQLFVWVIGLMIGFGLLEWAVAGGDFGESVLSSSGVFLSAGPTGGSNWLRIVQLLEAATGLGVLFIVIGYMPAVYTGFSRRETAVSQLATRGGSPPAAGTLIRRAAGREHWRELERDLQSWEEWAAELMETHLSYPLLAFYRSQHVNQNWLAALTAMVDVAAFVKATSTDGELEAAEVTYRIGRHALADLSLQFRLEPLSVDRLSDSDFDDLFEIVERSTVANVDRETARRRLDKLRALYEPNAQALADYLALELPPWFRRHDREAAGMQSRHADRDLVG
jgi:hypothetical protein